MRRKIPSIGKKVLIVACALPLALALYVSSHAWPVPDAGQTKCFNNTGVIPCPQPGEPFYGQDGNYTINRPSYTKLDANGNDLSDVASEWVMVRDNVTGLIWEVKNNMDEVQDYSNPHDADNRYAWYDSNPATNGGDAGVSPGNGTDTESFISTLNALSFGGYTDWRIPTEKELRSLVDYSRLNPAIDLAYFPKTIQSKYWSSTTGANTSYAFGIYFYNGEDYADTKILESYNYVRAVRGTRVENHFIDNGDGTITDSSTGLMWQQATAPGTYTWEQALSYCENLTLAGYLDWRLPNMKELDSLVDFSRYEPSINITYFPETMGYLDSKYWSSTTFSLYGFIWYAWAKYYWSGGDVSEHMIHFDDNFVRAVRGYPSGIGDLNGDGRVSLKDAILGLQIAGGVKSLDVIDVRADVNGDGKIGMAEVVYILQKTAGLR